jgi:hypothetical protein
MTKSVTVQFNDGSTHVYDNVPEEIQDADIRARAGSDYPGKEISDVTTGVGTKEPETPPPGPVAPNMGEKAVGAIQTGVNLIGEAASHPLVQKGALLGGGYFGLKKLGEDLITKYGQVARPGTPPMSPTQGGPLPPTTPPSNVPFEMTQDIARQMTPQELIEHGRTGAIPSRIQVPGPTMSMPAPTGPATNAATGALNATNNGWIANALQQAKQYGPAMEAISSRVGPVVRGAGKALAPLAVASELFYTSPEERAQLKQLEAERRAKGWKPANER